MTPIDVSDLGRMALCSDAQGADFALWLPRNLKGVGIVNEPSAMCWVELACPDLDAARRFYGEVFGWSATDREYGGIAYTVFKVGDHGVAGLVAADQVGPARHAAHWSPYFGVADCDASAAKAAALGADVQVPPTDIRPGRVSTMIDPIGARLSIIAQRRTAPQQR
jgi:predicted enzyme related to lactoylglutathione lyase